MSWKVDWKVNSTCGSSGLRILCFGGPPAEQGNMLQLRDVVVVHANLYIVNMVTFQMLAVHTVLSERQQV